MYPNIPSVLVPTLESKVFNKYLLLASCSLRHKLLRFKALGSTVAAFN